MTLSPLEIQYSRRRGIYYFISVLLYFGVGYIHLEGFDNDWISAGTHRTATHTDLYAGIYTFSAQGSNNDDAASDDVVLITVIDNAPVWRTWWAYTIYALLSTLTLLLARREIIARERMKAELKIKGLETAKLHELDHLRARFVANISHEFRTPLTLLIGVLEKYIFPSYQPPERADLVVMHRNANRLLHLVHQLLDISRIEAGSMSVDLRPGNLNSFLSTISSQFASIAESRSIHFECVYHHQVDAMLDFDKIEKIIVNLLYNAFKFTHDGGTITLELSLQGTTMQIDVSDSGVGIPGDKLEKIFDRFYQLDDSNVRQYEGTGIGLALVKELVELLKGSISVKSRKGEGSCFSVILPYLKTESAPIFFEPKLHHKPHLIADEPWSPNDALSDAPLSPGKSVHILVIEDNPDLRNFLASSFTADFQVLTAADGEQGLAIAMLEIPDLIVTDLMIPKIDGVELCRRLKNDEKTSHIPIILLTAKVDSRTKISAYDAGADDYLAKPFNFSELKSRIDNLLTSRKKLRNLFSTELILKPSDVNGLSIDDKILRKVMEVIDQQIGNPSFSVEMLAEEMAMSAVQLYRKVKWLTGYTPNELIRNMRLERAASLMAQQIGSVAEIAYRVGFQNMSYFAKCFRQKFDKTPSEYMKT